VTGLPEKTICRSVTLYDKDLSSLCNLTAQIELIQYKCEYNTNMFEQYDRLFLIGCLYLLRRQHLATMRGGWE